jgi:hypothetical protein
MRHFTTSRFGNGGLRDAAIRAGVVVAGVGAANTADGAIVSSGLIDLVLDFSPQDISVFSIGDYSISHGKGFHQKGIGTTYPVYVDGGASAQILTDASLVTIKFSLGEAIPPASFVSVSSASFSIIDDIDTIETAYIGVYDQSLGYYGWIEFHGLSVVQWAYEDSGAPIAAGIVPAPGAIGLFASVFGLVGVRRRRAPSGR